MRRKTLGQHRLCRFIRAVFYAVIGIFARPEAESVVMLCGDNSAFHAGSFERLTPLVAVEFCRIEYSGGVGTVPPLCARVSVRTEMHECVKRSFRYKSELICIRLYMSRLLDEVLHVSFSFCRLSGRF